MSLYVLGSYSQRLQRIFCNFSKLPKFETDFEKNRELILEISKLSIPHSYICFEKIERFWKILKGFKNIHEESHIFEKKNRTSFDLFNKKSLWFALKVLNLKFNCQAILEDSNTFSSNLNFPSPFCHKLINIFHHQQKKIQ